MSTNYLHNSFILATYLCNIFLTGFFLKKITIGHSHVTKMIFRSYCRNKKQGLNRESNKKDPQKASKNGRIWRAIVSHLYQLHTTLLYNVSLGQMHIVESCLGLLAYTGTLYINWEFFQVVCWMVFSSSLLWQEIRADTQGKGVEWFY